MADPMTLEEAMVAGSEVMDKAESRARSDITAFRNKLRRAIETVRDAGIMENGKALGSIRAAALIAKADALATRHLADLYELHHEQTEIAKELGIDGLLITPAGGGR
jgi:hypothetical protein